MKRRISASRVLVSGLILAVLASHGVAARVPKRIATQIQSDIVPAFQRDDYLRLEKMLSTWVSKFDGEELDQIDSMLTSQGAVQVGQLLLDARIASLLAGRESKHIEARELSRSMPVLSERTRTLIEETRETEYFQETLPSYEQIQEYHDSFWDLHVIQNKLRTASKLARYGQRMTSQLDDRKKRGLSETELDALEISFADLARDVAQTKSELDEIGTELQILAIGKAAKAVREADDYQERLRAGAVLAFYVDPVLEELSKARPQDYDRPVLQDPQLLPSVESNVRYARESSGDIIEQARLLYLGMHWWMRGRYGQGPDGMGLLKSVHALRSPAAQFPLYMPIKPPTPTASSESSYGYSIPKFDRRHHYIWMYEYRTIQQNIANQTVRRNSTTEEITSATKLTRFY